MTASNNRNNPDLCPSHTIAATLVPSLDTATSLPTRAAWIPCFLRTSMRADHYGDERM